jgi:uncharacterized phage infection (PIP) family protein YhgE
MAEEIKDVNAKIDEAEAAVKKYASKDTVIAIGGYEFTPAKLMIAFTIVSSTLGGLYGCFEVYKDYQDMKSKIAKYVSPDLTEVYKKLAVIEENSQKTSDYTRDIKGDLKNDIRASKQTSRETDQSVKEVQNEVRQVRKESEQVAKNLERDVDRKIQRALDNPLAK